MQFKISKWKKEIWNLLPVWCVLKMYIPFVITDSPFSRPTEWSSPRLERFAAQHAWQSGVLDKSQKTMLAIFRKKKKTTGLVCGKHKRKGCLDRPECPTQPSWHPASVSKTNYISATPIMAIHKNATTIPKLWKMPLQFLQTSKNATAIFANFEKRHCNFCKLWKMPL